MKLHLVSSLNPAVTACGRLFQPSDNLSFRLIGDYSKRNEECCGAPFLPAQDFTTTGPRSIHHEPGDSAHVPCPPCPLRVEASIRPVVTVLSRSETPA